MQLATEYFTKQAAGKTVLYMILDGKSLVTIFFAEGKYYYDSTSRVFAQPGTPEFAREIYSSISSIRQFISAQHLTETVKDVLFSGLTSSQVIQLANDILNIDSAVDISLTQPPQGTSIAGSNQAQFPFFVYPIAGLRKIDERMPILKNTKQSNKKKTGGSGLGILIGPFIGIFVLVAITYGVCLFIKTHKTAKLKEIESYNNNPSIIAQVNEYDAMYNNMADMGKIQGGVDLLKKDLDSYPIPDSSINKRILEAANKHDVKIEVNSYSSSTGIFSITAFSPEVEDINLFIADLMAMDIFENIDYTGYAISSDGSSWQINVVCTLAAREPADSAVSEEGVN